MKLEDLKIYTKALELGELVWDQVNVWNYFAKDTVGKQWVRAIDSVAANISEGYGRYSFKENRNFCFYSRGSLMESRTWTEKAKQRDLISEDVYKHLKNEYETLGKMLNSYIHSLGKQQGNKPND
jgi:four helix bundle protein